MGVRFNRYTKEELIEAVRTSRSKAEVLRKLGIKPAGGNYLTLKTHIRELGLDTSHFEPFKVFQEQRTSPKSRTLEEIFDAYRHTATGSFKRKLLKQGYKEHKCENCKLDVWLNRAIPLELHHVDGDRCNNKLENIQLLCPNCHALTDNYRGRKKKKTIKQKKVTSKIRKQRTIKYKIEWPSVDELLARLQQSNYSKLSKELGVSDNAIRKRFRKYNNGGVAQLTEAADLNPAQ